MDSFDPTRAADLVGAVDPDFDPDNPLFQEFSYPSMFGEAEVFTLEDEEGTPLRVLLVDGGFQSATYLDGRRFQAPFAYCQAFGRVFDLLEAESEGRGAAEIGAGSLLSNSVSGLLLGGGAFSFPKQALAEHPELAMDVVEIDPVVIDIARKHFFVDELESAAGERLRVFAMDGVGFLRQAVVADPTGPASPTDSASPASPTGPASAAGQAGLVDPTDPTGPVDPTGSASPTSPTDSAEAVAYDFVINDSFGGTVQDAPLLSPEALFLSKAAMKPGGIYMANVVAEDDEGNQDEATLQEVHDVLGAVFANVVDYPCEDDAFSGSVNHVFMASESDLLR